MKRVLQILIGLVIVLVLAYWLLIDRIIEHVIETEGSKEVKAKVELDDVDFRLYPTSIVLHGLQVTNPSSPMKNLLQAERISLDLDLNQVIKRHIVAEEMQLNGLSFNRGRSESGAIPGLTPPPPEPADYGLAGKLPSVSMADARQMVDAEKQRIKAELQQIQQEFQAIEKRWQERVDAIPDKPRIAEYKARAKALEEGSALQRLSGLNTLSKDLQNDLRNLSQLEGQLKTDLDTVRQQLAYVRNMPQAEAQRLLAQAGIDDTSLEGVVKVLFGQRIADLLAQGFSWYQQSQAAPAEPVAAPGEPEWLVLVKRTVIDGELDIGETRLGFDGVVNNLTHQQPLWELPITFALNGSGAGQSQFSASGNIDHIDPDTPADQVEFALTSLPLSNLRLSDQSALGITLTRAIADLSGTLSLNGDKLNMNVLSQFQQAVLQTVAESGNSLAQMIAEALAGVSQFGIDLSLTGNIDDPRIGLKSDLDRILGQAVGGQLKAQAGKLQAQLLEQLQAELGPEVAQLQDLAGQLQGLEQLLSERRRDLNDVVK